MTNAQIIFNTQLNLMKAGTIGTTGKQIVVTDGKGEKHTINEPEPIHTFAVWKNLGFSVKKGQHAIAKIRIWKYSPKTGTMDAKNDAGETVTIETDESSIFMKDAFFFKLSQVEPDKKSNSNVARHEKPAATVTPEPASAAMPAADPEPIKAATPEPVKEKATRKTDIEKAIETINKSAAKHKSMALKAGTFDGVTYTTDTFQLLATTECLTGEPLNEYDANTYKNILKTTENLKSAGSIELSTTELKNGIKELKAGKRNTKIAYTTPDGITVNAEYLLNALIATGSNIYMLSDKKAMVFKNDATTYLLLPINCKNEMATGLSVLY